MNTKFQNIIKNFSYAFLSNLVSILVSLLSMVLVPKVLGIGEYGYWQLYIFYSSYVGFLHFGWCDGVYLRYGGHEYSKLDKNIFSSQFFMLIAFEVILSSSILTGVLLSSIDSIKTVILVTTCICGIITIPRTLLLYILQATNRIKEYARLTLIDRALYGIFLLFLLICGVKTYIPFLMIDLLSKLFSLLMAIYYTKQLIVVPKISLGDCIKEITTNIVIGSKLMLANAASMLIIGIVRFGIERNWDIETFGKVSLTMSISSFLMGFINSIGIVIFPILRRTSVNRLPNLYSTLRTILMVPLLLMLVLYYPINVILSAWIPQYTESLAYMALLFPMCVFESKMSMLINTYLKTLRKEKWILLVNVVTVILSLITTAITVFVMDNLSLAVVSIVLLLAFRCVFAEIWLAKYLNISVAKDIILEVVLTVTFMCVSWFIGGVASVIIYLTAYLLYLVIKKNDILSTFQFVKLLFKAK